MSVPWRVAAQAYTVLRPDTKEPMLTLQFIVDHQQADVARLRIVQNSEGTETMPALEVEFATGGYPVGAAVLQPRWLKAFERPMPVNGEQRVALAKRREVWMNGQNLHEDFDNNPIDGLFVYREPSDADVEAYDAAHPELREDAPRRVGPDGVADGEERPGPDGRVMEAHEKGVAAPQQAKDTFVPGAAQQRSAGVDVTQPSPEDRKGMVGMGPGSEIGGVQGGAGQAYNPSPGITPSPQQGGGQMTGGLAQGAPGGPYATPLPDGGKPGQMDTLPGAGTPPPPAEAAGASGGVDASKPKR